MSFLMIKTEVGARIGAVATGSATAVTFIDQLSTWIRLASLCVTFLVGLATLAYYVPLAIEKWEDRAEKRRAKRIARK